MKLRIQFTKKGPVKYIGHLDTMRFFQRAVRRAGFDLTYSQGFSPHPVMSFASPLGVGLESESEIFDLEVNSITSRSLMLDALNAASCEGIVIRDIRLLDDTAGNAMSSVAAASYLVGAGFGVTLDDPEKAVSTLLERDSVPYVKKTKKGEANIDIRPGIYDLKCMDGRIYMLVDASSAGNIKPEHVVDAMYNSGDTDRVSADRLGLDICRCDVFGRSRDDRLIPLIEFGSDF